MLDWLAFNRLLQHVEARIGCNARPFVNDANKWSNLWYNSTQFDRSCSSDFSLIGNVIHRRNEAQNILYLTIWSHEISRLALKNRLSLLRTESIMQINLLIVQAVINVDVHLAVHYLMQKSHVCFNTDDCSFTYHCIRYDILDGLRIY